MGLEAALSPTQRSLKLLRDRGYKPWIVERYISFCRTRVDFFGIADIFAIHPDTGDMVVVQTTSLSNLGARIKKIEDHENVALLRKAGIGIQCHGWRKLKSGWTAKEVDLS